MALFNLYENAPHFVPQCRPLRSQHAALRVQHHINLDAQGIEGFGQGLENGVGLAESGCGDEKERKSDQTTPFVSVGVHPKNSQKFSPAIIGTCRK